MTRGMLLVSVRQTSVWSTFHIRTGGQTRQATRTGQISPWHPKSWLTPVGDNAVFLIEQTENYILF